MSLSTQGPAQRPRTRRRLAILALLIACLLLAHTLVNSPKAYSHPPSISAYAQPQDTPMSTNTSTPPAAADTATPTGTGTPTPVPTDTPTATATIPACGWNWRVVEPPSRDSRGGLGGITALSNSDIWAVTESNAGNGAQHWDGSSWTANTLQFYTADFVSFSGVGAIAPNDVWAVGFYARRLIVYLPLFAHWDGNTWTRFDGPSFGDDNHVTGVAAVASNSVWAVGYWSDNDNFPVIHHWNGSAWSQVSSPVLTGTLSAIAAVAANDIWAGGYDRTGTLTEHWNGTNWSLVPSPNPGTNSQLNGVAHLAANDVWAVGQFSEGTTNRTLIEHWDGSAWTIVPSPNTGPAGDLLNGVAAASVVDVWAAGESGTGLNRRPLVEHWDGSAWAIVPVPVPTGSGASGFRAIAVVPHSSGQGDVWAAGYAQSDASWPRPLTEQYSYGCPFTDVTHSDYFYDAVRYLHIRGVLSGYADNTFRPYNLTTRAQLTKIVVLDQGWSTFGHITSTFRDVPITDPFYDYIETAYSHNIISGYTCGPGCIEFRPGNNVTRGQLCKIVALARGWPSYTPPGPTFQDVPSTDPFYTYIEAAYSHNIISGYDCGPGCLEFRPGNNATRGQISKIVYLATTSQSGP
jgi:hypothetical protein